MCIRFLKLILFFVFGVLWVAGCEWTKSPFIDDFDPDVSDLNARALQTMADIPSGGPIQPFRFVFMSDSHQNYDDLDEVVHWLRRQDDIDFVVHGGDFTNFSEDVEYDIFLDAIRGIPQPLFVVIGNHDSIGRGPNYYRRSFGSLNFYFDWNGFRFVFWNNNLLEFHKQGIDWQWLEDTVQEAQTLSLNAIVIHHVDHANKQYFSQSQIQRYEKIIQDYNVPLVLNGHRHKFVTDRIGNTTIHQTSRLEGEKFSMIEVDGTQIEISRCREYRCFVDTSLSLPF